MVMSVEYLYHKDDRYKDNTELDYGTVNEWNRVFKMAIMLHITFIISLLQSSYAVDVCFTVDSSGILSKGDCQLCGGDIEIPKV